MYLKATRMISRLGDEFFPNGRFSSAGAIVGCTFPEAAATIRQTIPRSPIVVVGYGAQAGSLAGCIACFTDGADGAIVNASRSLTYAAPGEARSEDEVVAAIRTAAERMGSALSGALADREAVGAAPEGG